MVNWTKREKVMAVILVVGLFYFFPLGEMLADFVLTIFNIGKEVGQALAKWL